MNSTLAKVARSASRLHTTRRMTPARPPRIRIPTTVTSRGWWRNEEVVEVLEFETEERSLRGEMTMTTTLADADGGTEVQVMHEGIPIGVSVEDNEIGTRMALDNLAAFIDSSEK